MQGKISWKFWTAQWGFGDRRQAVYNLKKPPLTLTLHGTFFMLCCFTSLMCVRFATSPELSVSQAAAFSVTLCEPPPLFSALPRPWVFPSCSPPPPFLSLPLSLCFSSTWAGNVIYTWMNKFLRVNILRWKRTGVANILWCDGMSFSSLPCFFPLSHLGWCWKSL